MSRLKTLKWECLYLRAFLEICDMRYGLTGKPEQYRLEICAAAYNAGFQLPLSQLETLRELNYVKKARSYWRSHVNTAYAAR